MVIHLDEKDFNKEVKDTDRLVLVDFWAQWCGPCKMIAPLIESLSNEIPEVIFAKVDVDQNLSLAREFGIASIPTLKIFKGGNVVDTITGFKPKEELEAAIKKHL